jgi:hypothetical protein
MSHKKGYPSAFQTWQDLLQAIGVSVLLIAFLCACNFATRFPKVAKQPDMTIWTKIESPLFPAAWPPASGTVWTSYTFAYGTNPAKLMDGAYVTNPLSKTEWKSGKSITTVLSSDMTEAAAQGVLPLDSQTSIILENEKQVSAYCLKLTELPNLNLPETKEMLAYYQAWFKYNDAFLGLIRANHMDFVDWVSQNK